MSEECTQVLEWLPALIEEPQLDVLEEELLGRLRLHLEQCSDCQQELADLREFRIQVQESLAYLPSEEEEREIAHLTSNSCIRFLAEIKVAQRHREQREIPDWARLLHLAGRERRRVLKEAVARVLEQLQFPDRHQFDQLWKTGLMLSGTRSSTNGPGGNEPGSSIPPKTTSELVTVALKLEGELERGNIPALLVSSEVLDPASTALRDELWSRLSSQSE